MPKSIRSAPLRCAPTNTANGSGASPPTVSQAVSSPAASAATIPSISWGAPISWMLCEAMCSPMRMFFMIVSLFPPSQAVSPAGSRLS